MGNTAAPMPPMLPTQVGGTSFPARLAPLAGSQSVPLALPAGARVVAEVVRTQTDGQVLLRLGQTLLAATLPGDHAVGEQLPLIVLSEPGAQPALLLAPQTAAPASQAELSSTAQLLARLQQQAAPALRAVEPLWPQPDGLATPRLADALASSVRSSGLFYESHLAAWVQGELPTQALLEEPQGRLSQLASTALDAASMGGASASAADAAGAQGAAPAAALQRADGAPGVMAHGATPPQAQTGASATPGQAQSAAQAKLQASGQSGVQAGAQMGAQAGAQGPGSAPAHVALGAYASVQAQGVALPAGAPAAGLATLPAQLQTLVQQQLATLAQGAVVWAGQAWPGQELEWRIEPDDHGQASPGAGDASASRAWTSVLRLDLPRLGRVVATLQLGTHQELRVRVEHDRQAGEVLQAQGAGLRQAVLAAGLRLDELVLRPRTKDGDA